MTDSVDQYLHELLVFASRLYELESLLQRVADGLGLQQAVFHNALGAQGLIARLGLELLDQGDLDELSFSEQEELRATSHLTLDNPEIQEALQHVEQNTVPDRLPPSLALEPIVLPQRQVHIDRLLLQDLLHQASQLLDFGLTPPEIPPTNNHKWVLEIRYHPEAIVNSHIPNFEIFDYFAKLLGARFINFVYTDKLETGFSYVFSDLIIASKAVQSFYDWAEAAHQLEIVRYWSFDDPLNAKTLNLHT